MTIPNLDEPSLYLADVKRLYKRLRPKLKSAFLVIFFLVLTLLIVQPPTYLANASFKQASRKTPSMEGFKDLFKQISLADQEGNAFSLMRSKRVLRAAVEEMGLQFSIDHHSLVGSLIRNIFGNIGAELRLSLADDEPFVFKKASYAGEKKQTLYLRFLSHEDFEVLNEKKEVVTAGKLHVPVVCQDVTFTLEKTPARLSFKSMYCLTIKPWLKCVQKLQKKLAIKTDKFDKNVLLLSFSHTDRQVSAAFLNCLMDKYRTYLKEENEDIAREEFLYLEKRQDELCQKFDKTLEEHVAYLQKNLGEEGFIGLNHEIQLFSAPKEEYQTRLLDIDLELKRFEKGKTTRLARQDKTSESHEVAASGKRPKQETGIEQSASLPYQAKQQEYENQLLSLDLNEKKYRRPVVAESRGLLSLHDFSRDFQWANLEMVQSLYLDYNNEIDAIQAKLGRLLHIREEMKHPEFEPSSLGNFLEDRLSLQLIEKASQLMLQLRDAQNTSSKEHERFKEALDTQKASLAYHIEQMIELEQIHLKLLEEKLAGLQDTSIELIKNEKALIRDKLHEIRLRMAHFPEKWRKENQLKLKAELGRGTIEGMTQLMESKNIARHLYHVESKAIDKALAPLKPEPSYLLLFSIGTSLLGVGGLFASHLFRGLSKGLPPSLPALKARSYPVCGHLSALCSLSLADMIPEDLETLRRMASFVSSIKGNRSVALIAGKHVSYAHNLAHLLTLQGLKVLLMPCIFDGVVPQEEVPGFWHYLTGHTEQLPLSKKQFFDYLPTGSTSKNGPELLATARFAALLAEMKTKYDVVLLLNRASAGSAEADLLVKHADALVVTVGESPFEQLQRYRLFPKINGQEAVHFVIQDDF